MIARDEEVKFLKDAHRRDREVAEAALEKAQSRSESEDRYYRPRGNAPDQVRQRKPSSH
jgi:hypothetical protein